MRKLYVTTGAFYLAAMLAAPLALAKNDGRGYYGEVNDKVITNVAFLLIVAIPLFVFVMTVIQSRLEHRKDARKAAAKARKTSAEWHGGW